MADSTPPAPGGGAGGPDDLGHLDPGRAPWLETALRADVEVDPATMERHIAAALEEFSPAELDAAGTPMAPGTRRSGSPGRARWLTVAAAVVVTLGAAAAIVGVVASPGSDRVDSVAEEGSATNAFQADEDAAGSSADESSPAPGVGSDDRARAATDESGVAPTADLGEFANDDDLRRAIVSSAESANAARESPAGGPDVGPPTALAVPEAPSEERAVDAPTLACPPPDAVGSGWKVLSATVDGARVLVIVPPDADPARIVVYDAATCTIRPR